MPEPQEPTMMDHEVDGIRELDNKLPRWWVWLFHLTTLFAVVYMLYYHVFDIGDLQAAQYERSVAAARGPAQEPAAAAAAVPDADEPSTEQTVLARGRSVFTANCVVCHGQNGEGLIGPNLCDDFWIHGPTYADSLHTIREGVPAKGMISWKTMLKPADITAVASYIYTLRGTTPPNAKAPEGQPAGGG